MELFPIVKLSVIIFGAVTAIVMLISYISFKLKQRPEQAGPARVAPVPVHIQYHAPAPEVRTEGFRKEQTRQSSVRKKLTMRPEKKIVRPENRFMVVNQQQNDLRNQQVMEEKPFYHPRAAEAQRQLKTRKAFDLFDNYSEGGEKLHKLNLSASY